MLQRLPLSAALVLLPAVPLAAPAQEPADEDRSRPQGWRIVTDRVEADTSEIFFVSMPPGVHVTTGPAAIFYHPDSTATAPFRVEQEVYLFDPGSRNEAFGVFVGGRDLQGSYQAYTYFLIRRSGEYLIKRREGASTETLRGWTAHAAVAGWDEREEGDETVKNVLAVEAGRDELVFHVNGEEVDRVARRSGLAVDGIVGYRVNHALNVHISGLEITGGR